MMTWDRFGRFNSLLAEALAAIVLVSLRASRWWEASSSEY